ncbi:NAD-dependent succinate-semialdehyde dehydrogenase [Serratia marcescens]|nr:NAD-dependent succinate-semialdehyde dehydrogenase [Serratia marcescens]RTF51733.1 NAD-dependent succinate-semialdehyde dehydrogenase [Serratia marcescens]RTG20224.1 NAD-dependent succinate-semialdehyde dehydrogenase [Serratia marcescens]
MNISDRALFRQQAYINGQWRDADNQETLPVSDPATGQLIGSVPNMAMAETQSAIDAAQQALEGWRALPAQQRAQLLRRWFELMLEHQQDLASLMTLEQGKPLAESLGEIRYAASFIEWFAEQAKRTNGDIIPSPSSDKRLMVLKQGIGVCAAITPWNFPAAMITRKAAPALAAGCTLVVKPANETPYSALAMAELAERAGIPAGVFNVVTGNSQAIGAELTRHPQVRKLSFTGSTPVGKSIARAAADRLTRVTLELGGKNPAIVLKDADPQQVIEGLMLGSFLNQGQVCAASSRIYIEAPIYDRLVAGFEQAVKSLSVGPGMDTGAQINPLVSLAHRNKVAAYLDDARAKNAELIGGAAGPDANGFYIPPTLVINPDDRLNLTREEVFGPVVNLIRVASAEEALSKANDTDFGLTASLWTTSLQQAMALTPRIQAGTVWVNTHTLIDPNMPFGGFKQSGSGRDFGPDWLDAYTETKSVCIRY